MAVAAVLNLLRVVDNIQHPSRLRLFPDPTQIDDLREKLSLLQDFFELHSKTITEGIESMARKIPRVTHDVEFVINKFVVEQLRRELQPQEDHVAGCNTDSNIRDEIQRVMQEISAISEAMKTLRATQHTEEGEQHSVVNKIAAGNNPQNNDRSPKYSGEKNRMVGFDDQLKQVLEMLSGNQPNLVIVPIVGMGGIGKTTLARSLFDHPYNRDRFHVRIWLTISQDYSIANVLQGLLEDGNLGDIDEEGDRSEAELMKKLHQKLFGQRYLIVLDDVWSAEAWDYLRRSFPDNGNGSRVLVTTRLSEIASSLGSQNNSYSMKFLDEDKSWDLFSAIAFERGGRSRELEEIGREISKRCKGLPLLLAVIGGLLADKSLEYWKTIANTIKFSFYACDDDCLRILLLSYHHLPIHLKPCFLYTRHFREDSGIHVSKLVKEWVIQGFVKPIRGKSLEEAARIYLEDLVGRNMFFIRRRGSKGNISVCGIHDLMRDLCIKESDKEQLLNLPQTISLHNLIDVICALCNEFRFDLKMFYSETSSESTFTYRGKIFVCSSCESKFPEFPRVAVKYDLEDVSLLTYCSRRNKSNLHTLRLLWNLDILEIGSLTNRVLEELWEMPQLRHVRVFPFTLTNPIRTLKNDAIVLENLQTMTTVTQLKLTEEIVRRIPNLRKLVLICAKREDRSSSFHLQNLARLRKLESLSIDGLILENLDLKKAVVFPCSLKKLKSYCYAVWTDLTIIGSLPNLQLLKLKVGSVSGDEWNPVEGELFLRLKYLELSFLSLKRWRVNETHFPALETIYLNGMNHLKAIPREIGELPSLNLIHVRHCVKKSTLQGSL